MHFTAKFLLSVLAASAALAEPLLSPHVVHERRSFSLPARGWKLARRMEPTAILPLRIGLTQPNIDTLAETLDIVSHPDSPSYGKHWTPHQIMEHFTPTHETMNSVINWLTSSGFSRERLRLSKSRGWIEVSATIQEVEDLLKTEYHVWQDEDGTERVGCDEYSVPQHVQPHVDIIKPTIHMGAHVKPPKNDYRKRSLAERAPNTPAVKLGMPSSHNGPKTNGQKVGGSTTLGLDDCDQFITPICLQTLYNIKDLPVRSKKNTFGVVEFTPQAFLQTDLDMFFHNFSAKQVGQTPQLISIDGGVAQTANQSFDFNGESDLDLEYAMTLTNPQPIMLLQTGDLVEGAGFDNWLDAVDASFCTFEGAPYVVLLM